jgi:hypothetical protein
LEEQNGSIEENCRKNRERMNLKRYRRKGCRDNSQRNFERPIEKCCRYSRGEVKI